MLLQIGYLYDTITYHAMLTVAAPKIKIGLKFIHKRKPQWPYQVSGIDPLGVIVSWSVDGIIYSTIYDKIEVINYFTKEDWVLIEPTVSVSHPS